MKAELAYSGMLVKELATKSGVSKYSLDNYLNVRGQLPSIESGLKIAQALGVTVEYLVTGNDEDKKTKKPSHDLMLMAKLAGQLNDEKRKFVIDFIKWLITRDESGL